MATAKECLWAMEGDWRVLNGKLGFFFSSKGKPGIRKRYESLVKISGGTLRSLQGGRGHLSGSLYPRVTEQSLVCSQVGSIYPKGREWSGTQVEPLQVKTDSVEIYKGTQESYLYVWPPE